MKLRLKYFDPSDVTTFVNKETGKHIISDGFTTIPIYKDKLYSIKDVVNSDGTINKFQEGGTLLKWSIELELPIFRHLKNSQLAQNIDQDLDAFFAKGEIQYGQLSKDARRELQRKYNLDLRQIKETLDDLYNIGLGKALIADLITANPKNAMEHVLTYLNLRKVNGSKDAHYNKFLVLDKSEHTGVNGVHYNDKLSLLDLQRIKAQQLSYLSKAKSGTKLIPKNYFRKILQFNIS